LGSAALAQEPEPTAQVIAIPPLATVKITDTDAGTTWGLANQIANLISADLKLSSKFIFADIQKVRIPSYPEVTAPSYPQWRSVGAKLLLQGFVNARSDGRLTIGCYLYDVQAGRELARQGFAVSTGEWRRAAHKCADMAYQKATGNAPLFDSRIAYVAESGGEDALVKRIAVMDFDGANHTWLSSGDSTVLTPKLSPGGAQVRRHGVSEGHRQCADVRQPHRLCGGERKRRRAGEAARGDGFRRRQPHLADVRRLDGTDPETVARRRQDRLHQLRRRQASRGDRGARLERRPAVDPGKR